MTRDYRICTRCIMDTTAPDIRFDENGVCNHCRQYEERAKNSLFLDEAGQRELARLVNEIKNGGRNKEYDCIIGVSGGLDSTFVAYNVKKLGLRPLAVHVDNHWDSELAVSNVEKVVEKLGIDLYTYVIDWEEFRDVQLAFLKASVPDAEIPTDHAIGAAIKHIAAQRGIPYIISGGNLVTEGILPASWTYNKGGWGYIECIHNKFGQARLDSFPRLSLFDPLYYSIVKRIQSVPILNYLPYNKKEAMQLLEGELGWNYYGGKHYESIYTRFVQGYILPSKFNIDKRRAHLSTLICSGQMTREDALEEMKRSPYPDDSMLEHDRQRVIKKLGLTEEEFESIMSLPTKTHSDYPTCYYPFLLEMIRLFVGGCRRVGLLPKHVG